MFNNQRTMRLERRLRKLQTAGVLQLALASAALGLALLVQVASAQDALSFLSLSRDQFRSGEEMLRAFAPVSAATRYSIVKFRVDGKTVALGAIVDTNGLALSKASELKKGKLTCWLAS